MTGKDILFGEELRSRILKGASIFSKAVTKTMGPKSGTVMISRLGGLLTTKDGVTVAREVQLRDPAENTGCSILKEAYKLVVAGYEPMGLMRDIKKASEKVKEFIIENSQPIEEEEDLMRVAYIACNGDRKVAECLTEACLAVGKNGTVVIDEGNSVGIELEFKEGLELNIGACSSYFLNGGQRSLISPLVAVIPKRISDPKEITSMLEESSQWPKNDLLLISYGVEGEALKTMVLNHTKDVVKSCSISVAGVSLNRKDYLKDLAAICGCEVLEEDMGYDLENFDPQWFGSCTEVNIRDKKTIFTAFDEAQESISKRITELEHELASSSSDYSRDKIQERISKLTGGFCLVKVGGYTEAEMKEKRARIEDALGAVQSALRSGVVAGGGVAYLTASRCLSNEGAEGILKRALQAPLKTIMNNANQDGSFVAHKLLSTQEFAWDGWDVFKGKPLNMAEAKIFDPLEVAIEAVTSSVSVASMLITVEAGIF